ncbi:hypothetical protein [Jannaschia rubra]|uniref:Uncharacterized protein n=1 Tax=Jannaschia rubra TaxID=282197 RepID=A0A0M6XT49_9RHOB|nr:hypothetical protein [Jannaschia rubra]CTQ33345.1 hypothetical protein JAN5088_02127 [Jannaschia rubra]SFF99683.1 hypothetical protein SAMN04488517_102175 [Jannaschia rubra]
MTGARYGQWPWAILGSLAVHGVAAVAALALADLTFDPPEAPELPTPEFSISLQTLAPATLAGVEAVHPDPAVAPVEMPPESLPPISDAEPSGSGTGDTGPSAPLAPIAAPHTLAPIGPLTPLDPIPPSVAGAVPPAALTPVGPLPGPSVAVAPVAAEAGPASAPIGDPDAPVIAALPPVAPAERPGHEPDTIVSGSSQTSAPSVQDVSVGELLDRVAKVPGQDCTLALPRRAGADGAALALIGTDGGALDRLAQAILTGDLAATPQTRALIDPRQCHALDWLRGAPDHPATRLGLRLDATVVDSGTALTGIVQGVAGRYLTVLLIDDNGVVQDLGPFTTVAGNVARIDAPVNRDGPARDTRQIVVALTTRTAPSDLRDRMGRLAEDVFTGLPDDILRGDLGVETVDIR